MGGEFGLRQKVAHRCAKDLALISVPFGDDRVLVKMSERSWVSWGVPGVSGHQR